MTDLDRAEQLAAAAGAELTDAGNTLADEFDALVGDEPARYDALDAWRTLVDTAQAHSDR